MDLFILVNSYFGLESYFPASFSLGYYSFFLVERESTGAGQRGRKTERERERERKRERERMNLKQTPHSSKSLMPGA